MTQTNCTQAAALPWEAASVAAGACGDRVWQTDSGTVPEYKGGTPMEREFYGSAPCGQTDVRYYLLSEEPGTAASGATPADGTENGGIVWNGGEDWNPGWYGVLVEKGEEQAAIPDLDSSRERVQDLLARMVRGVVTPVSARDVAEDWLLSW